MDREEEQWRQYEPLPCYWVSNLGRIKRLYKNGNEKYLCPWTSTKGYKCIDVAQKPKQVKVSVHTMVAQCFIENPYNKPFVDHINEDKADNRASNLRWATNGENRRNISKLQKNNTSGCVGITARKYKGEVRKWRVRITINDQRINIGEFDDFEDAVCARREAEERYFGEFCPSHESSQQQYPRMKISTKKLHSPPNTYFSARKSILTVGADRP